MVRGHQDKRVLELSPLLQHLDHLTQMPIEPLDFERVIEQITADEI